MDPVIDARLKSIEEKIEKNQQLLIRIRRTQRHGQFFKIFYWVVIILLACGSFYFIQPYFNQLLETYTGIQTTQEELKTSIPNLNNVNELIQQIKGI